MNGAAPGTVAWVERLDEPGQFALRLDEHELDLLVEALYVYRQTLQQPDGKKGQLVQALRKIMLRAQVDVIWGIDRLEAAGVHPSEST